MKLIPSIRPGFAILHCDCGQRGWASPDEKKHVCPGCSRVLVLAADMHVAAKAEEPVPVHVEDELPAPAEDVAPEPEPEAHEEPAPVAPPPHRAPHRGKRR